MAISSTSFNAFSGAASDIMGGFGDFAKAQGAEFEAQAYQLAAGMAMKNLEYTKMSTAVQQAQEDRKLTLAMGETRAQIAGAGFAEGGSALDILRSSAEQGALSKAVLGQQGLITEEGYREQAQAYTTMESAAQSAASQERQAGTISIITGVAKAAVGFGTL